MRHRINFPEQSVRQEKGIRLDKFVQLNIYVNCIFHYVVELRLM